MYHTGKYYNIYVYKFLYIYISCADYHNVFEIKMHSLESNENFIIILNYFIKVLNFIKFYKILILIVELIF